MSDDFNPTDLNAIEEQRATQREQSRFDAAVELEDIRWLMSSKRGRRLMWRLLGDAGLYQQSFNGNTNWSIFNEGKRSIALRLTAQIHTIDNGAELYAQMANEAKVKEKPNG
ncbi:MULTISPECIES: endopeptidase [unclassified Caballeronia]|uniref:Bbp19 family protein n=1 Tax=unclassified Caballeronia TaxID=2646786 RepID=UPI002863E3AB|nr:MULTISPECIES: endopeptidase [unclassified Caballeronia]MDR5772085.1 endopeptidase [Caballeronia sp. LZ002]MDR5847519.1 endopeptidase [Caballeronia sp. LZ003]